MVFCAPLPASHSENTLRKIDVTPAERARLAQPHSRIGQQLDKQSAVLTFLLRLTTDFRNEALELLAGRNVRDFVSDFGTFDMCGGVTKNKPLCGGVSESAAHRFKFFCKSRRGNFFGPFDCPLFTIAGGDTPNL